MSVLLFFLGLITLVAGAHILIRGASQLALTFGISPLVVGLTIVAFGTSAPELAVSINSTWSGQVDLALGNAVGSNIFNILFILGVSALITPLLVAPQVIRQEVPVMVASALLLLGLAVDGDISRLDGIMMFGLLLGYTALLIRQSRKEDAATREEYARELAPQAGGKHRLFQIGQIIAGLVLLVLGANWLVEAAVTFARLLGLSEVIIGLTIVAAGTSLPEVATSVVATLRGERDIAVGNVIGSTTFNTLGVLGASALFSPAGLTVTPGFLAVDLPVMIAATVACLPIFFSGQSIARWEGGLFLFYYFAYTLWLLLSSQTHPWLPTYNLMLVSVLLPLTAVALVIHSWHQWRAWQTASDAK